MSIYVQIQSKSAPYENRWIEIGDSAVSFDSLSFSFIMLDFKQCDFFKDTASKFPP